MQEGGHGEVRSSSTVVATKASSSGPASHSESQQALAMARPATASGVHLGSASGARCRTPAGRLPEPGPKAMRRSSGWIASELDAKQPAAAGGNPVVAKVVARTNSRSSSVSHSETSVFYWRVFLNLSCVYPMNFGGMSPFLILKILMGL